MYHDDTCEIISSASNHPLKSYDQNSEAPYMSIIGWGILSSVWKVVLQPLTQNLIAQIDALECSTPTSIF